MKITGAYQRKKPRIEIIPLIDIIFFLLATFVMVSLSMVKNQGIVINLPVAVSGQPLEKSISKTVTVTEAGEVFLDKENVGLERAVDLLKELKGQGKDVQVLINGDDAVDFGVIVKILDEVRRAGISKVSIQTQGARGE